MSAVFRYDKIIINAIGEAIAGAYVYVCTQPNSIPPVNPSIPPSPLATLFTDATGVNVLPNPVQADGNGNIFFYAPTGTYTLVYFDPFSRIPTQVFPDQPVSTQGGGSVTSVALALPDNTFSVSGSPVSGSGTLTGTYTTQTSNTFLAGPVSGSAATPTWRSLAAGDLTGLVGSVTSVNASVTPGALFTASFSGGPITVSGVLALVFDFNNQSANLFLAGPSSGGSGAVTARLMVPADLPAPATIAFSATPTFNGAANNAFFMTLTGNVTSSTFSGGVQGQWYLFSLKQDGTGGRTFAFPSNCKGAGVIDPTANSVNTQLFYWDGTNLQAVTSMSTQI